MVKAENTCEQDTSPRCGVPQKSNSYLSMRDRGKLHLSRLTKVRICPEENRDRHLTKSKKMSKELEKEKESKQQLDRLEKNIEECHRLYELYFMGIEKREPAQLREVVKREIALLRTSRNNQATFRFRLTSLSNRLQSLSRYWDRVNYEREQGTFHKDRKRTLRRVFNQSDAEPSSAALEALKQPSPQDNEATPPDGVPAYPGISQRPDPSLIQQPRLPEQRMRQIYDSYLEARSQCGESTRVNYEALVKTIESQIPRLQAKGYKEVDFQVIVKDGKAALKPVGKT